MNKKLIALALASAFAAPMAMAADGVTIYGTMGVSYDLVDSDGAAGATVGNERRSRISSNNSHIGFKGTEDLNSDLSAIWQFEYAVQMDQQQFNQAGQASSDAQGGNSLRNTFVGLSSKRMGALTLGTQESPLKTSTGPLAVFGDTLADYRSVFTRQSTRQDNSVLYTSPNLGGLTIRGMYGATNEAGNGDNSDPRMWAASLVYSGGPFYGTVAYEDSKSVSGTNVSSNNKTWRAGIGYTLMGNTKFGLAYENNDRETAAGGTADDGHAWYGSVSHRFGNVTLAAAYTDRSDTGRGVDDGAKQYTGGVSYAFSKRTSVYALYTKVENDDAGTNYLGQGTGIATVGFGNVVAGGDAEGLSLGMVHKF